MGVRARILNADRVLGAIALAAIAVGCGPKDWRVAKRTNTSASYGAYASAHAGEPRAAIAARRAEARGWEEANAAGTSAAYTSFVAAFPASEHAIEARVRAETIGWTEAKASGTLPDLTTYLARYPQSVRRGEAEGLIEGLFFEEAKAEGTIASWGDYLVRYPMGAHAAEATAERDRLTWQRAVMMDTRSAYKKYLDSYPQGAHAAEASAWLAESYVTRLQPVIALIESHQGSSMHKTVLARIQREFDDGLLADLKDTFEIEATRIYDGSRGFPHPHDLLGTTLGTGVLVIEYYEREGRRFEPSGTATDITAVVRLYAPNTRNAVWVRELAASTPTRVYGADRSALNLGAIGDLGDQLRSLFVELTIQRPPEGS